MLNRTWRLGPDGSRHDGPEHPLAHIVGKTVVFVWKGEDEADAEESPPVMVLLVGEACGHALIRYADVEEWHTAWCRLDDVEAIREVPANFLDKDESPG